MRCTILPHRCFVNAWVFRKWELCLETNLMLTFHPLLRSLFERPPHVSQGISFTTTRHYVLHNHKASPFVRNSTTTRHVFALHLVLGCDGWVFGRSVSPFWSHLPAFPCHNLTCIRSDTSIQNMCFGCFWIPLLRKKTMHIWDATVLTMWKVWPFWCKVTKFRWENTTRRTRKNQRVKQHHSKGVPV